MRSHRLGIVALAASVAGACRHAPPAVGTAAPAVAPAPSPAAPAVSLCFLDAGGATPPALPPGQRLVAPFVIALPLPDYPDEAFAAGAADSTVVVRVLVDTQGRVGRVAQSPLAASTPGPYAAAFRTAVDAALARWEFYPAHLDTVKGGEDLDGDNVREPESLVAYTPVEVYYDVAFEFRVAAGRPSVTLAVP